MKIKNEQFRKSYELYNLKYATAETVLLQQQATHIHIFDRWKNVKLCIWF